MIFGHSGDCLDRREKNKQVWRGGHSERKEGGQKDKAKDARMRTQKGTGDGKHELE